MARAGLAYAAMLAASVSAGALGYAVIWAYTPDEPDALAPSVSAAVMPPVEVAAQPGPPGVMAPVVSMPQAPASEPVTVSPPAIAAAPAEPVASPVGSEILVPQVSAALTSLAEPPKDATPAVVPLPAAAVAARPAEESQARPVPGVVTAPPAEVQVVRSSPALPSPAVPPREHAPVGSTTRPGPPVTASPKPSAGPRLAALPPAQQGPPLPVIVSDAPQILVLRGGLRRATSVRPRRLATLPAPDTAAHDAPRITVLRGGAFRSAHTALLPPVRQPAITVVRGIRPAAPGLAGLAPSGPLVLRIRD